MKGFHKYCIVIILAISLTACSVNPTKSVIPLSETTSPLSTPILPEPTIQPTSRLVETHSIPTPAIATPVLITSTKMIMDSGLTWLECHVPEKKYAMVREDMEILKKCVDQPKWSEKDTEMIGEYVKGNNSFHDLKITIEGDNYETKLEDIGKDGCCFYKLFKNGDVILRIRAIFMTNDPNRLFWNIGGNFVWELAGFPPVIIVDGENYNEKYQWEGSYFPYEIKGKLLYVAKKDGKYHVVYDGQFVGPEFDEISMPYCCAMIPLIRGSGKYWFVGNRDGKTYVVLIQ